MGLYKLQEEFDYINSYDEYFPERICEECFNVYIETGDPYLAEQYLNEQQNILLYESDYDTELGKLLPNWNDLTPQQKTSFAKEMSSELRKECEAMRQKEQEFKDKHPTLYKIKGKGKEYYSKIIEFLKKQKDWFVAKLNTINKWANNCRNNKDKTIFSRIIAFIVRVIKKIANKIADLVDRMKR